MSHPVFRVSIRYYDGRGGVGVGITTARVTRGHLVLSDTSFMSTVYSEFYIVSLFAWLKKCIDMKD